MSSDVGYWTELRRAFPKRNTRAGRATVTLRGTERKRTKLATAGLLDEIDIQLTNSQLTFV